MRIEIKFPYFTNRVEQKGKRYANGRGLGWAGIEIRRRRKGIRSISVWRLMWRK